MSVACARRSHRDLWALRVVIGFRSARELLLLEELLVIELRRHQPLARLALGEPALSSNKHSKDAPDAFSDQDEPGRPRARVRSMRVKLFASDGVSEASISPPTSAHSNQKFVGIVELGARPRDRPRCPPPRPGRGR